MSVLGLSLFALLTWCTILLLPWQPHRTRERLESNTGFIDEPVDLDDVTVLIPARNEGAVIGRTLSALCEQGPGLEIVVIDDNSEDGTGAIAAGAVASCERPPGRDPRATPAVRIIQGEPLPPEWGGKLWALQQGLDQVSRRYTLLLDADIVLAPGMLATLLRKIRSGDARLVSIMARLRCEYFWERLLVPPFIFFFKLWFPFARVNDRSDTVAAAAGGCVLVETTVLRDVDAFHSIRGELIDDCALARRVKDAGRPIWLALSRSVCSTRPYRTLGEFWRMVSRTAFTQLRYSGVALLVTTAVMAVVFLAPVIILVAGGAPTGAASLIAAAAILAMAAAFLPAVRFYGLSPLWALSLPAAATLYLLMTWSSAFSYWRGTRATWKNRAYGTSR